MKLEPDFSDMLAALKDNQVEFVIVGSFALAHLGWPRATKDLDIWIKPERANAERVLAALRDFGFGSLKIKAEDFLTGKIIQLGRAPVRIDLITILSGVSTSEIWDSKRQGLLGPHKVFFIGKEIYVKNKLAAGRAQDLADVRALGQYR